MAEYYYCSSCGDGPNSVDYAPSCPVCFAPQNNASQSTSDGYYTNAYTLYAHTHPQASRDVSDSANTGHARNISYNISAHTTYSSGGGSSTVFPVTGIPQTVPYGQRTEGPPLYRWQCCKCGGDNSYKTDQGCANCSNHWRSSCCHVYDANNPRR